MDYKETILADPVNRWVFSLAGKDIYLVGGYLRDMLRGFISTDKDFVINGNVEEIAKNAAVHFNGTFITLKKDQTYRIALKSKSFLDITRLDTSIKKDLSQRDYTVNALAWAPDTGMIDYGGGIDDIKSRQIRAVKADNIAEDPLRILRAYRLSAQLGFDIERNTRSLLKQYSPLISNASSERITDELYKVLNCNISHNYLKLSNLDNVLHEVIGLSTRIISRNIDYINKYELNLNEIISSSKRKYLKSRLFERLNRDVSQSLSSSGLIKLSLLLLGSQLNSADLLLTMSNSIKTGVKNMNTAFNLSADRITGGRLYDMLRSSESCEYEAVIMISLIHNKNVDKYLNRADEYLSIRRSPALSGNDIMDLMKISPGNRLGELKEEMQRRQFLGNIRNRAEARSWIIANLT